MVKICSTTEYTETKYNEYFEKYDYPLHIFQKFAIEGIVSGNHVLVCAPTGSGKTLPGEFALDYFHSKGKKTIYCSPIKALSNQKFYDFSRKYPHISFGIITGDIKNNPNADVLIMTTEILLNKLYQIKSGYSDKNSSTSFDMDIETELGCVIFDEIHMINDQSRGHVWEQSIMMLPRHVQMIGLSATLDNPEKFSNWLETRGESNAINTSDDKIVYLAQRMDRAVPLTHYSFITTPNAIFKAIKDKVLQEEIKSFINKPHIIQKSSGKFEDDQYHKMNKMLQLFENNNVFVKRSHVLNQVATYLSQNEMLPAICYVFSRKQLEICAKEMNSMLLEDDSKVPYIVQRECEQIIRKLPNFEEYLHLPEYLQLISFLEKGVAIHHSGMLPVLREIVEILFQKGYIKLLFATESVAIGLNLPVKTTIFTDIFKHDGTQRRMLYGHEYVQAGGRAGRLGIDTKGNVIHLNNLFRNVELVSYKQMMNGKPQILTSKFKISYNLLFNLIEINDNNFTQFAGKSMIQYNIDSQVEHIKNEIDTLIKRLETFETHTLPHLFTDKTIIEEYITLTTNYKTSVNKKRKDIERRLKSIKDNYKHIDNEVTTMSTYNNNKKELKEKQEDLDEIQHYLQNEIEIILTYLQEEEFIKVVDNDKYVLDYKGTIACHLKEVNCLVFSTMLKDNLFDELTCDQLVGIFSCFTNINVSDEVKSLSPQSDDPIVNRSVKKMEELLFKYKDFEISKNIQTGTDYEINFDIIQYAMDWVKCEDEPVCKMLLEKIKLEKEISIGEFSKAILKINNIANEITKIAENNGNVQLLHTLNEISNKTLKFIITNQSLYI